MLLASDYTPGLRLYSWPQIILLGSRYTPGLQIYSWAPVYLIYSLYKPGPIQVKPALRSSCRINEERLRISDAGVLIRAAAVTVSGYVPVCTFW